MVFFMYVEESAATEPQTYGVVATTMLVCSYIAVRSTLTPHTRAAG